jgi:hypothetical protein
MDGLSLYGAGMTKAWTVGLALVLTACGGDQGGSTEAAPPAAPSPGPQTFIDTVRGQSFGTADLASAPEASLLSLGNLACTGLEGGTMSVGEVVQGYVESDAKPTTAEAEAFTRAAVTNLCPAQAAQLPR